MSAVCWNCVDDRYFKEIIREKGEVQECSECHSSTRKAFSASDIAEAFDPVLREHYVPGRQIPQFGEGDEYWHEQEGDPLSHVVQEILNQSFPFDEEIVDALIENDGARPQDGEEPFFSNEVNYVPVGFEYIHSDLYERWRFVEEDLKHNKRFFSSAAKELFEHLFHGIEVRRYWDPKQRQETSVVCDLPEGTELFRARICNSNDDLKKAVEEPFKNVGPPPPELARAGRMNVDGVAALYGALDEATCLAEIRPTIGGEAAVITVRTKRALRLLDFTKIKNSYRVLSYFQPDFKAQAEKNLFFRQIESLISQPVRPGRESDYLITQTMAEYLAYVHGTGRHEGELFPQEPFSGLLYKSVQKKDGTNLVLFSGPKDNSGNTFPVEYVANTVKFFRTASIKYEHHKMDLGILDGEILQHADDDEVWLDE